jgi:hypothetical protein
MLFCQSTRKKTSATTTFQKEFILKKSLCLKIALPPEARFVGEERLNQFKLAADFAGERRGAWGATPARRLIIHEFGDVVCRD